jgi:Holliday junction resolvase RusA-like endonuclease
LERTAPAAAVDKNAYEMTLTFPFRAISKDNEKVFNRAGRPFLSAGYKRFEQAVRREARRQWTSPPLAGNIGVALWFYFRTKVHGDLFNLPKGVLDALSGVVYRDDRQVKTGMLDVTEGTERDWFAVSVVPLEKGGGQ